MSVDKIAMPVSIDIIGLVGNVETALAANIKMTTTTDMEVARTAQLENTQIKLNKAVAKIAKVAVTTIHKRVNETVRPAHVDGTKTKVTRCHAGTAQLENTQMK